MRRADGTSVARAWCNAMDNRQLAEWLIDDAPPERPPLGDEGEDADDRSGSVAEAVEGPSARPAALRSSRRTSGALDLFEGHDGRILELIDAIGRRIRRRPLAALAVGVGIGFVVGGAMSFRAGRILLAAGMRRAARELLKQLL